VFSPDELLEGALHHSRFVFSFLLTLLLPKRAHPREAVIVRFCAFSADHLLTESFAPDHKPYSSAFGRS
jgi:hypothetical protein